METKARIRFDGRVAVVMGADGALGRSIALAMGARGAALVVAGVRERALGELVGEIAYGGGKARHVVVDAAAADPEEVPCARGAAVFGRVDAVVLCPHGDADDAALTASTERALEEIADSLRAADGARLARVRPALVASQA